MVSSSADLLHKQKSVHLFKSSAKKMSHSLTDFNRGKHLCNSKVTPHTCVVNPPKIVTCIDTQTQTQFEDVINVCENPPQKVNEIKIANMNVKPFADIYSHPYIKTHVSHSTANTLKTYNDGMEFWEHKNSKTSK